MSDPVHRSPRAVVVLRLHIESIGSGPPHVSVAAAEAPPEAWPDRAFPARMLTIEEARQLLALLPEDVAAALASATRLDKL